MIARVRIKSCGPTSRVQVAPLAVVPFAKPHPPSEELDIIVPLGDDIVIPYRRAEEVDSFSVNDESNSQAGKAEWRSRDERRSNIESRHWRLMEDAFLKLMSSLDSDPERAGEKYVAVCRKLATFFEYRGCHAPLDFADETIDRVTRRLHEGEEIPGPELMRYIYGVARNILKEYYHSRERQFVTLDCVMPYELASINQKELEEKDAERLKWEEQFEHLEQCMKELTAGNRELLTRYYQGEKRERIENRQRLANQLGMSTNALKIRAYRIRRCLENCVASRCGGVCSN